MTKDLISVIIPVYNIAPYLEECLDSLLNQTYSLLEIILVDDGSSDGSADICDRYAAADSRVKVIHQPNGGVSAARNNGLSAVNGEYFTFVDGDDYLDPDAFEAVHSHITQSGCSMICFGNYRNNTPVRPDETGEFSLTDRPEALKMCLQDGSGGVITPNVWGKLYRTESTLPVMTFDPSLAVGEDLVAVIRALLETDRVGQLDRSLYHYRQREGSVINSFSAKNVTAIRAHQVVSDLLCADHPELIPIVEQRSASCCIFYLATAMRCNVTAKEHIRPLISALRDHRVSYLKHSNGSKKQKLLVSLLCLGGMPMYRILNFVNRLTGIR